MDTMSQLLATTLATMTPTETAAILRQFNEWRRGDETTAQPDPREIGEAIDAAVEMIEASEKERELWAVIKDGMITPAHIARGMK